MRSCDIEYIVFLMVGSSFSFSVTRSTRKFVPPRSNARKLPRSANQRQMSQCYSAKPNSLNSAARTLQGKQIKMKKKRSEETQTLRAGCSKAEPKNFAPPQTPFPWVPDSQNLISWRWSLPLPRYTNPVWSGSMHTISSYRGNSPTNTATDPHKNRQGRLQYTVPQLARSLKI